MFYVLRECRRPYFSHFFRDTRSLSFSKLKPLGFTIVVEPAEEKMRSDDADVAYTGRYIQARFLIVRTMPLSWPTKERDFPSL